MSRQITSDKIAEAIDTLKQAGFAVFEPEFVPHVLIEVEGGVVQNVSSNVGIRAVVMDSDIQGMDKSEIVAGEYCITESDMFPPVPGPFYDRFKPSDTVGGSDSHMPALYEYFKSINF